MQEELSKAAERGSKIHRGIELLLNDETLDRRDYTPEEFKHLMSFERWYCNTGPVIHAVEETVYDLRRRVAGTLDIRCTINGVHTVIDVKTSSGIFRPHLLQSNEYAWIFNCNHKNGRPVEQAAILRTNSKHKVGYEWKVWDVCEKTHKLFVCLHHIDFDLDSKLETKLPRDLPETLFIPKAPRGQPMFDDP